MRLSRLEPLLAIVSTAALCFASPGNYPRDISIDVAGSQVPFNFTYLFTAHLSLGAPQGPIPIPGGVRIIEAILNGTVTGPAINATLGYSLATPSITNNGTIQRPIINAVGTTDDGLPLYLYETGLGSPNAQVTRIVRIVHA